ncbi:MAG TPA: type III pantothenate kinase [Phycisphaerae bacterium]|nr:type III pantothenate kinase [Phycisphaerae bacterium]
MDDAEVLQDPRSAASLLIFEIGNSHVSVATAVGNSIRTNHRFARDQFDAMIHHADEAWDALPDDRRKAVAAASVVPDVLAELRGRLEERYDDAPLLAVGDELHRPMSLAVEAPETVGVDRVCSAAAAYDVIGRACAVASFGTAITIDCVNDEGVFMGGAILPGLALSAHALHEGTAALPEVVIEPTGATYGATTEQCIRNGVIYGAVGALREITERYATQLGSWPQLVVTGGNAELVQSQCEFIDNVVPDLCIRGIALAYRRHFAPFEEAS